MAPIARSLIAVGTWSGVVPTLDVPRGFIAAES